MHDLIVEENQQLNNQYFILKLSFNEMLPDMLPGQFVEVLVGDSSTTFLRRPLSINYVDRVKNQLWLLVQIVGDGTKKLSEYQKGRTLNIVYPLGNSYSEPLPNQKRILLVGGGVGTAPMLMQGSHLKSLGFEPTFLLGARSEKDLLELDMFKNFGKVYTTTEDGSHGEKGYVTQHSILAEQEFDIIYTCGPTPMMKAVGAYAVSHGIECEVSLENTMGCGIGACLCCVQETKSGHKCVCTEGPVFNVKDLKWQI